MVKIKNLGLKPYLEVYHLMHQFTQDRDINTQDEIWLVEHPAVYTQGKVGRAEHLLQATSIPIVHTDRGGQITYHAPGQQIMYILLDLRRLNVSVRQTVRFLENSVIKTLAYYQIASYAKPDAPGVYVNDKKICSLGLHIQRGCTLHGLALNIDMDMTPFYNINPCGYVGLQMTQIRDYIDKIDHNKISQQLAHNFIDRLPI